MRMLEDQAVRAAQQAACGGDARWSRQGQEAAGAGERPDKRAPPRHVAMSWANRLKRVFGIDIQACTRCGGKLKVIASIEEPAVIAKILAHLERMAPAQVQSELPLGARAPPVQSSVL
jgi:hypothetical protein